jgi:hypothetical protein
MTTDKAASLMKKRLLIPVVILAALALGAFLLLRDRPGVTSANCERIRDGMTEAEVEAIFGEPEATSQQTLEFKDHIIVQGFTGPSGDANLVVRHIHLTPGVTVTVLPVANEHTWIGVDCAAYVLFDDSGKVTNARWVTWRDETFLDRILGWLHLR